jgi:hypothetical protein
MKPLPPSTHIGPGMDLMRLCIFFPLVPDEKKRIENPNGKK